MSIPTLRDKDVKYGHVFNLLYLTILFFRLAGGA